METGNPLEVLGALVRKPVPDVILLDIHMGAANGMDAIVPIRRLAPRTRILMFTTLFDSLSEARALEAGAMGFLLKTDDSQEIVRRIYWVMEQPLPAAVVTDSMVTVTVPKKEVSNASRPLESNRTSEGRAGRLFRGLGALGSGRAQGTPGY